MYCLVHVSFGSICVCSYFFHLAQLATSGYSGSIAADPEQSMKAIEILKEGNKPKLQLGERPIPVPGKGEVLVKVAATALNRADILQALGLYQPPEGVTDILGLEAAGEVVEVGSGVLELKRGMRVCMLIPGGGYAEYLTVDERLCIEIPPFMSFESAAAIPEVWATAYLNLVNEGELSAEDSVLIHAGASGVGIAAIQLAKHIGARVYTTVGNQEKVEICESLGALKAVNYRKDDFETVIKEVTSRKGVDVILDSVGGNYLKSNIELLKKHGRLISIGMLGGGKAELDLSRVLKRGLSIKGSTLRDRPIEVKARLMKVIANLVIPKISNDEFKVFIDKTFPLDSAQQAHEYMQTNLSIGKIVLTV